MAEQRGTLTHVSNLFYTAPQVGLARRLVTHSFADRVFLTNSGAEAIEGALKFARKWARERGVGKHEIVAFGGSFHGRTMGALSITYKAAYRDPFAPLLPGVCFAPFTDLDAADALYEASSGGPLFLAEIGDLSPQVQAKLLRVLQECEVRRLGETRTRAVDLHLVAATHRDLARLVGEGRFRGDLLYRIAGITVTLSPLRERPRDLRVLLDRALAGTPVAPDARAGLLT